MQYRKFGKTGADVSILGFGCMRLPVLDNDESKIDYENGTKILRYAIDNGVNYVDTAYPYHGGMSEKFIGHALSDGYREKVYLATKLPSWLITCREDMDNYLDVQLKNLRTDHIDFYLVHSLNTGFWENLKKHGIFDFLDAAKADGRIKFAGFSFHDQLPLYKEIVDAYDWDFSQIQYNFMDENYQAGYEGLKYGKQKGLAMVVMEPLRGGRLASCIPAEVKSIWESAEKQRTPVEWALKFVWDKPEVSLLLSGMNTMEQIKENILSASDALPETLTNEETVMIEKVRDIYLGRTKVNCTSCKYCMPCPAGVNIPGCFSVINTASMYDDVKSAKLSYGFMTAQGGKASSCIECGACEGVCPQQLPIRSLLKEAVTAFE